MSWFFKNTFWQLYTTFKVTYIYTYIYYIYIYIYIHTQIYFFFYLLIRLFVFFTYIFFLSGFSFTDTDNSHLLATLQVRWLSDYHIFLIATLVFTRLLLDEIYQLIKLLFDWLMRCLFSFSFVCYFRFDFRFCYSYDSNSHQLSSLCYNWTD